jgi:metal-responsive CopG/Arc/MetJ family transcriptional regulator
MGQPKKGRKRINITLPPNVLELIDAAVSIQGKGCDRSYFIEQMARALLETDEKRDKYSLADFELIRQGRKVH